MDTDVDNSPYKASNQDFSPIQTRLDNTGEPYTQNWPSVGSYTFYKNGDGGYSARVQPIIFDEKSSNRHEIRISIFNIFMNGMFGINQ